MAMAFPRKTGSRKNRKNKVQKQIDQRWTNLTLRILKGVNIRFD